MKELFVHDSDGLKNDDCIWCPFCENYNFCRATYETPANAKRPLESIEKRDKALKAKYAKAMKEFAEQCKMAYYYEFEELIPSVMADKIDKLLKEYLEKLK